MNKSKPEKEFNWLEDTAEFGFDDFEELPRNNQWVKKTNQTLTPVFFGTGLFSFVAVLGLQFIPRKLREVRGYSLVHVFVLAGILSFLFLCLKLLVHVFFVVIKDQVTDTQVLHNKKLKIYTVFGIWFFLMLPLGFELQGTIPWAERVLGSCFICGILTITAFTIKTVVIETFRVYFLTHTLKKKAEEIGIKERIVAAMKEFCYEGGDSDSEEMDEGCFLLDCLNDTDHDPSEVASLGGNIENVVGSLFKDSILNSNSLSLHETLCLSRDVFNKCTKTKEVITFNDFCEIFPSAQVAVQAFLYFDNGIDKKITKKEMRDTMGNFHYDKKNFITNYNSLNSFVEVLDNMLTIVIVVPLLLIYLSVIGLSPKQILTFSLSSALFLNFFIGTIAKEFYWNTSFMLTHPFDIGDDVIIDGKDYIIYTIGLYKTEVLGMDGGKVTFLNKVLSAKCLVNITRAPQKLIHISFTLPSKVTPGQFRQIKKELLVYFRNNSETFYESFTIQSESESSCKIDSLNCLLIARCKSIGTKMIKLEMKIRLVDCLIEILDQALNPPTDSPKEGMDETDEKDESS
ncbi:hypothetical protein NEDG_00878 [Nematocida displodere]|uniref:EF-hand domain-containing protein n=1 Tax=Nematocida displodere TaxID=1805483 RepID=A0A177ECS5_9MICR|nr:hypothetical protein NEDG_00878 [Nematocida displodere]